MVDRANRTQRGHEHHQSNRAAVGAASKLFLEMDKAAQTALVHADVACKDYKFPQVLAKLMAAGRIKVSGGTPDEVMSFFARFDRPLVNGKSESEHGLASAFADTNTNGSKGSEFQARIVRRFERKTSRR